MDDWESHPNLKSLAELLTERDHPRWWEKDQGFKPEKIATDIVPYQFDIVEDEGEGHE